MVSDIFLMPELSSELQAVAWLDGARNSGGPGLPSAAGSPAAAPTRPWGSGTRSAPSPSATRPAASPGPSATPLIPAATWRFTLKPDGEGTLLEQWYQMGPARSGLNVAIDAMPDKEAKIVFVRLREHETAMRHNLEEIKSRAERVG